MLKAQQESKSCWKVAKKRGRKPKGGKTQMNQVTNTNEQQNPNIILHLKCQSQDLNKLINVHY